MASYSDGTKVADKNFKNSISQTALSQKISKKISRLTPSLIGFHRRICGHRLGLRPADGRRAVHRATEGQTTRADPQGVQEALIRGEEE